MKNVFTTTFQGHTRQVKVSGKNVFFDFFDKISITLKKVENNNDVFYVVLFMKQKTTFPTISNQYNSLGKKFKKNKLIK